MNKILTILFALNISVLMFGQTNTNVNNAPDSKLDTLIEVLTDGIFDGIFIAKTGYKINEYYISQEEMTSEGIDTLKGKRVIVKGKLKVVKGDQNDNIQKKYITGPEFRYYIYKEPEDFIAH